MFRTRFLRRLAILAVPMTLSVAGAGPAWAQSGSGGADDEPCKNIVLSLAPISLCKVKP